MSDRNAELKRQLEKARAEAVPEAVEVAKRRASDLEAEAARLRFELKVAEEREKETQTQLRAFVAEARTARGESVELIRRLEEARAETREVSIALAEEVR